MDINLVEILDYKVLTATLANFQHPELLGARLLGEVKVEGNVASWDVYAPSRVTGNFRAPGAPAAKLSLMRTLSRTAQLAPVLIEKTLDDSALSWIRTGSAGQADTARAHVSREAADLDRVIEYTKEYAVWQALQGSFTVNQGGVQFAVDYGFDATHTPTSSAPWANAASDIIADVLAWKQAIAADSGYAASDVYTSSAVMACIMKNTGVANTLGEAAVREQIAANGFIARFLGLNWHVYDAGYIDASGDFQRFIPEDKAVFIAADAPFGALLAGSQEIPAGFSSTAHVYGKFAYAAVETNPPGVKLFAGENFLPVIYIPDAVLCATATLTPSGN